jgi:hypothetical protein
MSLIPLAPFYLVLSHFDTSAFAYGLGNAREIAFFSQSALFGFMVNVEDERAFLLVCYHLLEPKVLKSNLLCEEERVGA